MCDNSVCRYQQVRHPPIHSDAHAYVFKSPVNSPKQHDPSRTVEYTSLPYQTAPQSYYSSTTEDTPVQFSIIPKKKPLQPSLSAFESQDKGVEKAIESQPEVCETPLMLR